MTYKTFLEIVTVFGGSLKPPTVSKQPTIKFESVNEACLTGGIDKKTHKRMCIETIINFNHRTLLDRFKSDSGSSYSRINILTTDMAKYQTERYIFSQSSKFSKLSIENFEGLSIDFFHISYTNKLEIAFFSRYNEKPHPLVSYLERNPMKAFKFSFIFANQTNNVVKLELTKVIKKIEKKLHDFKALLENDFGEAMNNMIQILKLNGSMEFIMANLDEKRCQGVIEAIGKFETIIRKIYGLIFVSDKIKLAASVFLNIAKFDSLDKLDINTKRQRYIMALKSIEVTIKEFFKEEISKELEKINISICHRERVLEIFHLEIDKFEGKSIFLLSEIIDKLKNKTIEASGFMTFETGLYRFDKNDKQLVPVV
ncbi:hypothetical protein CDIK_2878 [Cucumispora dikerogammari]|nr:hypothetical protein CDIK_2878 [Cucumispora dikerogammari]